MSNDRATQDILLNWSCHEQTTNLISRTHEEVFSAPISGSDPIELFEQPRFRQGPDSVTGARSSHCNLEHVFRGLGW